MITPASTPITPPTAHGVEYSTDGRGQKWFECPLCDYPNPAQADTCHGCGLTAPDVMEILGELHRAEKVDPAPPEFEAIFDKEHLGG
jgi:hypothetical protein